MKKLNCRIVKPDGRIKYAGTGNASWFTREKALSLADHKNNEQVHEYCPKTGEKLWEVL